MTGLAHRVVYSRRAIRMHHTIRQAFGYHRCTDHRGTIVVSQDQIVHLDPPQRSILRTDAQGPVVVAIDQHAVLANVVGRTILAIVHGVIAESRMRRDQLQRIALEVFRLSPLPGRQIFDDRRAFRIVGIKMFKARALEFKLAGLGLQTLKVVLAIVARQRMRLRHVLFPSFVKPPVRGWIALIFR